MINMNRTFVHFASLVALSALVACESMADKASASSPQALTAPAKLEPGHVKLAQASLAYVKIEAVGTDKSGVAIRAPARIAFRDQAVSRVGAPIPARVMQVHVRVGDRVKSGQSLATLASPDASSFHAELARAEVELSAAQDAFKRQEDMLSKGVGREYEKVVAEMRVRDAQERVRGARRNVGLLGKSHGGTVVVSSQIDGTVLRRNATVGAQVEPSGEPLFEIGNPNDLWVVTDVFQDDLSNIAEGAKVQVEVAASPEPVQGVVVSVGVLLDTSVRRAPVYVELDKSSAAKLKAGMFARATIAASAVEGITVPVSAVLIKNGEKPIVYVSTGPDTFVRREITLGHGFENRVQVLSGLQVGEKIAVQGTLLLDGAANQLL